MKPTLHRFSGRVCVKSNSLRRCQARSQNRIWAIAQSFAQGSLDPAQLDQHQHRQGEQR